MPNIPISRQIATLQLAPDEWADGPYQMTCGSAIAEARSYVLIKGKTRWWLYDPDNSDPGDSVYCTNTLDPKKGGDGFGGRTLTLPLKDGTMFDLVGGWHANTDALFQETGVDLRAQHVTYVVLATGVRHDENARNSFRSVYTGVLYKDPEGGLRGHFDRWKELALLFPQATQKWSGSSGGSCGGPITQRDLQEAKDLQRCKLINGKHHWSRHTINSVICKDCGLQMGHVPGLNVF